MLFIKKIETASDLEFVKKQDPHAEDHIWVLISNCESGKSFFAPMVPMDESELKKTLFFFKNKNETIWKGGYYISPKSFDLTFDGTIRHQDSPKPLLATLGVRVLSLDVNQDMTELISWFSGKNVLLTEEIDAKLAERKKVFFADLERNLYQADNCENVASSQDVNMQILSLAKKSMLKSVPWMNVEITFADTEAILSESEKEFKKYCDEMAEKQRKIAVELQQKQTEMSYRISLQEMQQNEKEVMFAAELREQDRLLALEQKELEMRILKETADEQIQKENAKIRAEREEIKMALDHKQELWRLEIREKELAMESDAEKRDKEMEILELQKQQEEKKLKMLDEKISFAKQYRSEKLKAVAEGRFFNTAAFEAMQKEMNQREKMLLCELENLRNQLTAAVGGVETRKTVLARQVSEQKKMRSISLKRENSFVARAISLVGRCDINAVKIGSVLSFKFRSPVSGYLNLFCSESSGGIAVLVPNFADQQIYVEAGREYEFPSQSSMLYGQVTQEGPEGTESVYAMVTPRPLVNVPSGLSADEIRLLPGEVEQVSNQLANLPEDAWAADSITYAIKY